MEPFDLQEDLRQEMFMVLLEMPDERLIEMHSKGYLKFFLVRTMLNMIKSNRSTFFRNFRNLIELPENVGLMTEAIEVNECKIGKLEFDQIFSNKRDELYERDMFLLYAFTFNSNALKLSRSTKIPYKTVRRTLDSAKNKIKCYLQSQRQ
jgi:hypothetical protein